MACTKTRNGETKPPKQAKRNETKGKPRNKRNETKTPKQDETTEMTENTRVNYEKNLAIYRAKTVAGFFSRPLEL